MRQKDAIVDVFWKAYQGLGKKQQRQIASRIIMDSEISDDWIDHVLIQRARQEAGEDVTLEAFLVAQE